MIMPDEGCGTDILELILERRKDIETFGVKRIGLFGSFARGCSHEQSDVDLVVEFNPGSKSFDAFMGLAFFLEDLLGRSVELVTPESLSPYIGPHILKEAKYVSFRP